ncbi:MAG: multidrug transporter permease [Caulobacter sp.]|nr:multidrug transporter permease [Caulobacter sp.]
MTTDASNRRIAGRVFDTYLKSRWKGLIVAVACGAVTAVLTGWSTQKLKPAFDTLSSAHPDSAILMSVAGVLVVLALGRAIAQIIQATFVNRIGHGLVGQIQVDLFGRLVRADLARLRDTHTGAFVSQVLYDAGLMREGATRGIINYSREAMIIVSMLVVMAYNDWLLTLVVLLLGPLIAGVMQRYTKRTKQAAQGAMAETAALSTTIMEGLDGIRIVKIEGREGYEEDRVAQVVARRQAHIIKGANASAQAAPVTEALTGMVVAGLLAYAGWRASGGHLTGGGLVAFLVALLAAAQSLRQVANLQTVMAEGLTAARRLFAAIDVEPEVREVVDAQPLPDGSCAIRFEDVSFAYGTGGPVLDAVTLQASKGETVALVGPSGGGKSTILSLIPRFYDATAGMVTIDGHDVRHVTLASLRERIGLVTQEPFLFDDSIRANIAYARPDASDEDIHEAARQAAAHDFICQLPRGYDTGVGEAGARLSGGQRQRIAIARAFLKDAPILLLDEATSALDTESEAQVQAALERLMAGRTTILIAHRLSTVKGADRIYVIDKGHVVETGDHAALLRKKGLYARLAQAQDLDHAPAGPILDDET